MQGAAWVTGVFALLEYKEISVETGFEQGKWEPSQLPTMPVAVVFNLLTRQFV